MALKVSDLPTQPHRPPKPSRHRRHYTVEQWLELPERPRTELIGGLIQKMPPPSQNHWRITRNITAGLDSYVLAHKLGTVGGEVGVLINGLTGEDGWVPDLAFASKDNLLKIGKTWVGVPDWVLEVWAGEEKRQSRITEKRKRWQSAGVPELWEITLHKGPQIVNVYRLDESGVYQLRPTVEEKICSQVISGFCIERNAIFANLVEEEN